MLPQETTEAVEKDGRRRGSFTVKAHLWRDMERLATKENRPTNNYFEIFLMKYLPEELKAQGLEVGHEYDPLR